MMAKIAPQDRDPSEPNTALRMNRLIGERYTARPREEKTEIDQNITAILSPSLNGNRPTTR
jgi:hypothetical protein